MIGEISPYSTVFKNDSSVLTSSSVMDMTVPTSSPYLFSQTIQNQSLLEEAANAGLDSITIFLESLTGSIPSVHPKLLKAEFMNIVPNYADIDLLKITRQGKIIIITKSSEAAKKIINIQSILNHSVAAKIQHECITTRFLLHNIHPSVDCNDIADELKENGISVLEVRRFLSKKQDQLSPSSTVLVTKIGTSLPKEVKLWFQIHRISRFWDKPRQCRKCFKYTHPTRACKSDQICIKCASAHEDPCSATVPKCVNCQGNHCSDDKICPSYQMEVKVMKFKSENFTSLSEARRKVRESEKGKNSNSYSTVVASAQPPKIDTGNLVTKEYLQETLKAFTENITKVLQSFMEVQTQTCQKMVEMISINVSKAIQAVMTEEKTPQVKEMRSKKKKKMMLAKVTTLKTFLISTQSEHFTKKQLMETFLAKVEF